jgi:hypothetical protein
LGVAEGAAGLARVAAELRSALKPRTRKAFVTAPTRKQTKAKKGRTKKAQTKDIRAAVMARADGKCEACGRPPSFFSLEMDHFFGRVRVKQSERNCWGLCHVCHEDKTKNSPDPGHWLHRFWAHAEEHGYPEEAGMAVRLLGKHQAKATLSEAAGRASHG